MISPVFVPMIVSTPGRLPTGRKVLVALAITAPALQALFYLSQASENFQIGMDFRLTYTVAAAWALGENAYDDRVLKSVWAHRGMPRVTPPGLPQTPNVYPLTIAPLMYPMALLPFPVALVVWQGINAACIAVLLVQLLTTPTSRPAFAVFAAGIFLLGFPLHYGFSFGNLAVLTTFLIVQALRLPHRPAWAGALLGLALVKYSLGAPLLLYMAITRRWRTVVVAGAVQVAMIAAATWGGGLDHPMDWLRPMLATASQSLQPGQPNHHAALEYTALHLELPALLHRLWPHLGLWSYAAVALMVAALVMALARSRRRAPMPDTSPKFAGPEEVAILAVTLLASYHRTYDLIVVLCPLLMWLLRDREELPSRLQTGLWVAAAMTTLPGATSHGGSPHVHWAVLAIVQPVAIWTLLIVALLTIMYLLRRADSPGPSAA